MIRMLLCHIYVQSMFSTNIKEALSLPVLLTFQFKFTIYHKVKSFFLMQHHIFFTALDHIAYNYCKCFAKILAKWKQELKPLLDLSPSNLMSFAGGISNLTVTQPSRLPTPSHLYLRHRTDKKEARRLYQRSLGMFYFSLYRHLCHRNQPLTKSH